MIDVENSPIPKVLAADVRIYGRIGTPEDRIVARALAQALKDPERVRIFLSGLLSDRPRRVRRPKLAS